MICHDPKCPKDQNYRLQMKLIWEAIFTPGGDVVIIFEVPVMSCISFNSDPIYLYFIILILIHFDFECILMTFTENPRTKTRIGVDFSNF